MFWRSCAQLLEAENARLAAQNATLAGTVAAQREQLAALKQRVVTLSRMLFGSSSEKSDPGKAEAGGGDGCPGDGRRAGRRRRGQRPGSAGHGRRRYEHLEAEEQIHDLPEGERCCPRCGQPYAGDTRPITYQPVAMTGRPREPAGAALLVGSLTGRHRCGYAGREDVLGELVAAPPRHLRDRPPRVGSPSHFTQATALHKGARHGHPWRACRSGPREFRCSYIPPRSNALADGARSPMATRGYRSTGHGISAFSAISIARARRRAGRGRR